MADNYDSALEQLRAHGLVVDSIDTSGRIVRVDCEDRPGKKHGWYICHLFRTEDGREFIVGAYGDWRTGDTSQTIQLSTSKLSQTERDELRRQREQQRRAAEAERRQVADDAAARARAIWPKLPEEGSSPYLQRKGVRAWGLRFSRGSVVVPLTNGKGELVGLQFIDPEGTKRFLTGTAKRGAYHVCGEFGLEGPIAICEGYATAATVHQAAGWPAVVAFDAGNLAPVADDIRKRFPGRLLVLCADDDHETAGNPGHTKAAQAAQRVSGVVALPQFREHHGRTDWNDLQAEQGLDAVRTQLLAVVAAHDAARQAVASTTFTISTLLEDFTVIHGTSLAWDARRGRLMSIANLRVSAGEALVKQWLLHPLRRMVDEEAVVFDPGNIDPRVPKINLFTGMELQPDASARCTRLLEHLMALCGDRERLYDWLLKWIALPLQRPGTKMQTAVVMYGAEGTGKNLFWGAVLAIYGRWGVIIGQEELESTFNGWESAKLFAVADEVVPRNEMRALKGRLKKLVTGDRVMINEKNQPLREERNALNLVFLSNENQPLLVDPGDRRYCGIRCDVVQPIEHYRRIGAELEAGGAEALYHYLLHYDLEDFDEHTKPFETDERADLIEAGQSPAIRFWQDWRELQLPLPYVTCRAPDLYQAFRAWCAQTGERFVPNETAFGLSFRPYMDRWFLKQRLRALQGDRETRPTCYVLLDATDADRARPAQHCLDEFHDAMLEYLKQQRSMKL